MLDGEGGAGDGGLGAGVGRRVGRLVTELTGAGVTFVAGGREKGAGVRGGSGATGHMSLGGGESSTLGGGGGGPDKMVDRWQGVEFM